MCDENMNLEEQVTEPVEPKVETEPLFEEMVDFDTFSKSDFRVVKVKECSAVKKSKKLLHFVLDDGTGTDRIILSGIHEYLQNQLQKRQLLVWSRADEIVLKNLKERYTVTSCTESRPHGFLRYSMPEILFVLNEYEDIEFLVSNFNQLSSLEIYVLKNSCIENFLSVVMQHRKKYNRVDVDFFLNNSYAIINKSGDADEIEMIVPKKDFLTSLEFYL